MDEQIKQYFINGKGCILNDVQNLKWLKGLFRTTTDLLFVQTLSEQTRYLDFKKKPGLET